MMTSTDFEAILDYLDRKETQHVHDYGLYVGDGPSPYDIPRQHVNACRAFARNAGLLDALVLELPATGPALKQAA